jgi:hypothetical protein
VTQRLGLDLGKRALKMIEGNAAHIRRHAETVLPEGALEDGMPTPLFTVALRNLAESVGIEAKSARVAISDTGVAVRDFRLPPLPGRELDSAVTFEARRLLPMSADEVYFAWHAQRDRAGYAVYLVAARRDMIDAVVTLVSGAGLNLDRIDLKPLALARGVGAADGLILEWDPAEATLVLVTNGRPRFFRTFPIEADQHDAEAQLNELVLSVGALVKFVRSSEPDVTIGPATPLYLAGQLAMAQTNVKRAKDAFEFAVRVPSPRFKNWTHFPWQSHLAGLGLLAQKRWQGRLTPSRGGDIHVAA